MVYTLDYLYTNGLATKILDLKDDILGGRIKVKQVTHACMHAMALHLMAGSNQQQFEIQNVS
jgi:hypothetical protein